MSLIKDAVWQHHLLAFGLAMGAAALFYWQTIVSTVAIWIRSETYAHGFIILPISLYLIWQNRPVWKEVAPQTEPLALLLLAGANLFWLLAVFAGVLVLEQLAVLMILLSSVLVIFGRHLVKAWLFPLGYLLFLVPFGDALVPGLRDITAVVAIKGLQLTGIPVFFEGRYIDVPSGSFHVAEACSGIRYLIAGVALATLFAYLNFQSLWRRLAYVVVAAFLVIAANGLRAYGIIMLAYLSDMTMAVGVDHLLYGWLFFGIVIALIFWLGTIWSKKAGEALPPAMAVTASSRPLALNFGVFAACVVIMFGGYLMHQRSQQNPVEPGSWAVQLPAQLGDYQKLDVPADWKAHFPSAAANLAAVYQSSGGEQVLVNVALYPFQSQGVELINYENAIYDAEFWYRAFESRVTTDAGEEVIETGIRSLKTDRMVWHNYLVGNVATSKGIAVKIHQAMGALGQFGKSVPASLVAVSLPVSNEQQATRKSLQKAWQDLSPAIRSYLDEQYRQR